MKKLCSLFIPLLLFNTSCSESQARRNKQIKTYPVLSLQQKDTTIQLKYVANIQACKNIEIHARVSGALENIYVDEGQFVRKGQLLFRINTDELNISLKKADAVFNSAKADARVARVELSRVKMLVEKEILSSSELDLSEAKLSAFKAKMEEALAQKEAVQQRISYASIYAPFDGVIDRLPLKSGSIVSQGSLLTTISDLKCMWVYFNISENEYLKLNAAPAKNNSDQIELMLSDGSMYPFKGELKAAESEINSTTGSIALRADFPNPTGLLKHGASGTLIIRKDIKDALLVPQKSVIEIQDKNYVYFLDKDNILRLKTFNPAQRIDGFYIVGSGLTLHDQILFEGIQSVKDGEQIKPALVL